MLIQSLSDTALAVAYARALETDRPDALFHDPFARVLAGERGKAIYQQMQGDRSIGWFISSRTVVLDDLIRQEIQQNGVDTVLNLAAGLDTRPYRMALPTHLQWIEVDLPPIFAYKQEKLLDAQPVCQLERVSIDLTNRQQRCNLLSQVNAAAKRVLVITEGFLVYLPPAQVSLFAEDLASQPTITRWLSDFVSPLAVKIAQLRMSREAIAADVQLQFAPVDINQFFKPYGWQVEAARSLWHEAHRLKREVFFGNLARRLTPFKIQVALLHRSLPLSSV
ncbi:MAG: SAM-dependent methyltransferase [Leptolyngbyaceae cyanobacterium HOT.MB2.61]|nr:SAM-dependent methyltransferase [Leptolyngbyaceae cyanobacterium HOT.MB2.61]